MTGCVILLPGWWEKERCQHKYPSWIHGGHGAAAATVNLHPLTQAGKHEAIGMAEDLARRATLPSAPQTKKTPVHGSWPAVIFIVICAPEASTNTDPSLQDQSFCFF